MTGRPTILCTFKCDLGSHIAAATSGHVQSILNDDIQLDAQLIRTLLNLMPWWSRSRDRRAATPPRRLGEAIPTTPITLEHRPANISPIARSVMTRRPPYPYAALQQ